MDRSTAEAMDRQDPLARFRDRFDISEDGPVYMDGNSLGRPPRDVSEAVEAGLKDWRTVLVSGWESWIELPAQVGDRLGRLLGAAEGQALVCDSTTVNLYKLASAALGVRQDRPVIVGDASDFPTDRYVLEGLARATGRQLRLVDTGGDPAKAAEVISDAIGADTALVCLSHVNYRSGLRLDVPALTAVAHEHGALVLWDLAHSAGAVPMDLDGWGVDLAVGCTYKYLNSGPGAPGFLYVRQELQDDLRQPIWGWFGRASQFEMGPGYEPAGGVASFMTGHPRSSRADGRRRLFEGHRGGGRRRPLAQVREVHGHAGRVGRREAGPVRCPPGHAPVRRAARSARVGLAPRGLGVVPDARRARPGRPGLPDP